MTPRPKIDDFLKDFKKKYEEGKRFIVLILEKA